MRVVYGGAPRALRHKVDELLEELRRAARNVGRNVDRITYDLRDAANYVVLLPYEKKIKGVQKAIAMRRGQLLAYYRSLLSIFCWSPSEPVFWASYEVIAERLGLSIRAAIDLMARIEAAGLVKKIRRLGRSIKEGFEHERGEATSNVWVAQMPPEAFTVLASIDASPPPNAPDASESAPPMAPSSSSAAPATAPVRPPALSPEEQETMRQLISAEPVLRNVNVAECLESAAPIHGSAAARAVLLGLAELAEKARKEGWRRTATQPEANGFSRNARLAMGASSTAPRETLEDVHREARREQEREQAERTRSLPLRDAAKLLKDAFKPP